MLNNPLWQKVVEFHGHECPGLAIGFKASEGAIEQLGLDVSKLPTIDEELVCIVENDACGVDAVQVLLGCTYGKSNLIPRLRGKMAFSFYVRNTDKSVRLVLTAKGAGMSRSEFQEYLLTSPYDQLFELTKPSYELPEPARMFASHDCMICGESTAEYALHVHDGQFVCTDCYKAYDREGF